MTRLHGSSCSVGSIIAAAALGTKLLDRRCMGKWMPFSVLLPSVCVEVIFKEVWELVVLVMGVVVG